MSKFAEEIFDEYPFLSLVVYGGTEYIGIIQNRDDAVLSIYDFGALVNPEDKKKFLDLGDVWWWESNRTIPINLFLKQDWTFSEVLRTFNVKDCTITHGGYVSISELANKRGKRRNIQLVKKVK